MAIQVRNCCFFDVCFAGAGGASPVVGVGAAFAGVAAAGAAGFGGRFEAAFGATGEKMGVRAYGLLGRGRDGAASGVDAGVDSGVDDGGSSEMDPMETVASLTASGGVACAAATVTGSRDSDATCGVSGVAVSDVKAAAEASG